LHHARAGSLPGGRPEDDEVSDRAEDVGDRADYREDRSELVRDVQQRENQRGADPDDDVHDDDQGCIDGERDHPGGESDVAQILIGRGRDGCLAHGSRW
jgi:hypothetical protein